MIDLLEIEVEIAKISNYQVMHLVVLCALQDLCQSRKDVPKSPQKVLVLEKGLAHDCYHICFPKKLLCWQACLVSMLVGERAQI